MEIQLIENTCIITPLTPKADFREWGRLYEEFKKYSKYKLGLDLSFIEDCTFEFIEALTDFSKSHKIGLFNISSDVFAIFNLMNLDKHAELFSSELDFFETSHRIINRKFALI